jgi:hypothetical protein
MPPVDADQLRALLNQWDRDSDEDRDERLTDFLVQAWPTRPTQDN